MTLGSDIYPADSFFPVNLKRSGDEIMIGSSHAYAYARSSFSTLRGALSGVSYRHRLILTKGTPCLTADTQCT